MKKNVVGHMVASKDKTTGRFRRWDVLPRMICLLLALLIWLAITNFSRIESNETGVQTETEESAS